MASRPRVGKSPSRKTRSRRDSVEWLFQESVGAKHQFRRSPTRKSVCDVVNAEHHNSSSLCISSSCTRLSNFLGEILVSMSESGKEAAAKMWLSGTGRQNQGEPFRARKRPNGSVCANPITQPGSPRAKTACLNPIASSLQPKNPEKRR